MTVLNEHEFKRHEYLAYGLLAGAFLLWAVAAWLRARQTWAQEYPHAMIGMAAVMLFTSLAWRILTFGKSLWSREPLPESTSRMFAYLGMYSLAIVCGTVWLLLERNRLPDIAWARATAASTVVLLALLAGSLPWTVLFLASLKHGQKKR